MFKRLIKSSLNTIFEEDQKNNEEMIETDHPMTPHFSGNFSHLPNLKIDSSLRKKQFSFSSSLFLFQSFKSSKNEQQDIL